MLALIMINLIFYYSRKHVRERCGNLNIKISDKTSWHQKAYILTAIIPALIALIYCLVTQGTDGLVKQGSLHIGLLFAGIFSAIAYLFITVNLFFRLTRGTSEEKRYFACLSKSLIPIFAVIMIFNSMVQFPIYETKIKHQLKNDLSLGGPEYKFTKMEHDYTQKLLETLRE